MLVSLYLSIVSLKVLVPRFSILRNIPRWFRSVPRFSMSRKFGGIKVWRISKEINLAEDSLANFSTYTGSL